MANEIEAYTNFLFYNSEDGKTSIQVIADADAETIWTTQKWLKFSAWKSLQSAST